MVAAHLFMRTEKGREKFLMEREGTEKDVVKAKLYV